MAGPAQLPASAPRAGASAAQPPATPFHDRGPPLPAAGVATLCLSLAVRQAAWMKAGVMVQTRAAAIKVALPAFLALFCLYQYMFAKKK